MGEAAVLCYPGGGAGREWLAMEETRGGVGVVMVMALVDSS